MDTLTLEDEYGRPVDEDGNLISQPIPPTQIPVRFRLYWAGSDKDGSIAGFYYAVTETSVIAVDGFVPPLPGPRPGQYRFTTKTDTTFVFTVSELFSYRKHCFYVYAVDHQGKPDATPARFIFTAIDKFPPRPVFDLARATGEAVSLTPSGEPVSEIRTYDITDTLKFGGVVKDTVPVFSRLDFRWRGEITQPGTVVTKYRYKLDELEFQPAAAADTAAVTAVSYGTGLPGTSPVAPGQKLFSLRALDQANGAGEGYRRFYMNFAPDTWWAGPDPADFTGPSDGEYNSHSVDVLSWPVESKFGNSPLFLTNPPLPSHYTFGMDSARYIASKRFPLGRDVDRTGTFYEIYGNRLYARTEGDTVHMNSIIVLWNGGYDKDSPYIPRVDSTDQYVLAPGGAFSDGPLFRSAGRLGSPIGFRSQVATRVTPSGLLSKPAQTTMYPIYEPASVFVAPRIGSYWHMRSAGKSFALARAEDSNGGLDNTVSDPVTLVENIERGGGTAAERYYRRKVLVFYVDKAPALEKGGSYGTPFLPYDGQAITTALWQFRLRGIDLDPYDYDDIARKDGGPTNNVVLRFKVTLYGRSHFRPPEAPGDTSWTYIHTDGTRYVTRREARDPRWMPAVGTAEFSFIPGGSMLKNPFASGPVRVSIQVCDCLDCEAVPGQGRCVEGIDPRTGAVLHPENVITVDYTRPAGEPALEATSASASRPGPGGPGRGE